MKKMIAKNEYDMDEVLENLTYRVMRNRLAKLYRVDEILEILGYYDESMDSHDMEQIDELVDTPEQLEMIYEVACKNGNFQQAICMNKFLPL